TRPAFHARGGGSRARNSAFGGHARSYSNGRYVRCCLLHFLATLCRRSSPQPSPLAQGPKSGGAHVVPGGLRGQGERGVSSNRTTFARLARRPSRAARSPADRTPARDRFRASPQRTCRLPRVPRANAPEPEG